MRMTQAQIESMVRYEDADVIVVHKPPFLAAETKNPRQQDLVSLLKNRRCERAEEAYIGLVHRLDQPVEGLLVVAKTPQAARRLCAGDFTKEYLAVAVGVAPEQALLVHTLKKDGRTNTSCVVRRGAAGGKEARLSYERLAVRDGENPPEPAAAGSGADGNKKSLLVVRLETGRHHQIRVQLAADGHPLWGDEKYGARAAEMGLGAYNDTRGIGKIPPALCSARLAFVHPASGIRMQFCTKPTSAGFAPFSDVIDTWISQYQT